MNTRKTSKFAAFAVMSVVTATLCGPVSAQSTYAGNAAASTTSSAGVPYAAGGVGLDARNELQREAATYNLRMMFAERSGEFLIPDTVTVRRGNRELLNLSHAGPLLYVKVPQGDYIVQASYNGVVRSKSVTVAGRLPDLVMTWPAERAVN